MRAAQGAQPVAYAVQLALEFGTAMRDGWTRERFNDGRANGHRPGHEPRLLLPTDGLQADGVSGVVLQRQRHRLEPGVCLAHQRSEGPKAKMPIKPQLTHRARDDGEV